MRGQETSTADWKLNVEDRLVGLCDEVTALAASCHASSQLPSIAAAVSVSGEVLAKVGLGLTRLGDSPPVVDGDLQFRIGSITKTFTSALVIRLAGEGLLRLDDRVEEHIQGTQLGRVSIAQLLSHSGGVQREPVTRMWQTFVGPDEAELAASLSASELVAEPGERWHYSNLGYAILGQIVRQVTGETCETLIGKRFVEPLNLTRTSWQSVQPAATGYYVDPFEDLLHEEPDMQQNAAGMGGQMWSTTNDLIEWAQALMGRRPDVLSHDVVEKMHVVRVLVDPERWTKGWGFGLAHVRTDDRIWSGHTGAVPGFGAALTFDRKSGVAVAVLTNTMDAAAVDSLALDLAERTVAVAEEMQEPAPDQPAEPWPAEFEELLGSWWFEGGEVVFFWRDGCLQAEIKDRPGSGSRLTQTGPDRFRATEGRERGELLVVHRDDVGRAEWLEWATYPYVRNPRSGSVR